MTEMNQESPDVRCFVQTFIRKERHERLPYELTTPKKDMTG